MLTRKTSDLVGHLGDIVRTKRLGLTRVAFYFFVSPITKARHDAAVGRCTTCTMGFITITIR